MVELSGGSTAIQHSIDNTVFIIPAVVVVAVVGMCSQSTTCKQQTAFCVYKLVESFRLKEAKQLRQKEKKKESKKAQ